MKSRLVSMGNSRGVRIPKALIEEVGLVDEVEVHVRDGVLVIAPIHTPRAGWAEAAKQLSAKDDQGLLDGHVATHFEDEEWHW